MVDQVFVIGKAVAVKGVEVVFEHDGSTRCAVAVVIEDIALFIDLALLQCFLEGMGGDSCDGTVSRSGVVLRIGRDDVTE